MKKISVILLLAISAIAAKAQIEDPAHWAYGLKKLGATNYEVHLQATLDDGWHIYAQKQSSEFVGTATKIAFFKQPGLTLTGATLELGKKEKYENKEVEIINYEYAGKVDFVQKVKINPGIKEIKGTITYQTCTNQKCLTEKTINFTVPVP